MKCSPHCRVFLGALLVVFSVDGCCGQTGNCSYQCCTHTSTIICSPGVLLRLQCIVYNAANIKWYHSQNGNAMELSTTTGGRYIANETIAPSGSRFENCTGDNWRYYQLIFNYNESDSGSYWFQIVTAGNIQLELSQPWMVDTVNSPVFTGCGAAGDTDPKCVVGPTAMPTLSSTTVLDQDYSTSAVGTTVKPFVSATTVTHSPVETPSVPSSSTATPSTAPPSTTPPAVCTVGGTSCFVYLGAGLGVLAIIVVLLVVIVIMLLLRRGKNKGGEENKTAYQALNLDSTDYTSMYSKIQESCKQQTPTVERGDHVYAVIDSTRVEPPSQYAELK